MKNKYLFIGLLSWSLIFMSQVELFGQTTEPLFNYQAVARTIGGELMIDQNIGLLIQIIDENSEIQYEERHFTTTSDLGIFILGIGTGENVDGNIESLDFANQSYSLSIWIDNTGGESFELVGTSPIVGVPFAYFAKEAATALDDNDKDNTNEIQSLTIEGNLLTLTNGGSVNLPEISEADIDPSNELQTISKSGNTITLSLGGGSITDEVEDSDADPSNEIQSLSLISNTLSLSNGGGSVSINTDDADADPGNEIQELSLEAGILSLNKNGGSVVLPSGGGKDEDSSNELQTLSKSGNTITLSSGGGAVTDEVEDNDADPNNEIQSLSLNSNTLSLSNGGGSVTLPSGGSTIWTEINNGIIEYDDLRFDFSGTRSRAIFKNSSGSTNVYIAEGSTDSDVGFVNTYANGGLATLTGGKLDDAGMIRTHGPNGNRNTSNESMTNFPDCGVIAVYGENGIIRARLDGCIIINNPKGDEVVRSAGGITADLVTTTVDHPSRSNREIRYTALHGPEAAAYTRGIIQLVDGRAEVRFAEDYKIVANPSNMTIMLTPHSATSKGLAAIERTKNGFVIKELFKGTGTYKVDWEVKSVRKGYERLQPVINKEVFK